MITIIINNDYSYKMKVLFSIYARHKLCTGFNYFKSLFIKII